MQGHTTATVHTRRYSRYTMSARGSTKAKKRQSPSSTTASSSSSSSSSSSGAGSRGDSTFGRCVSVERYKKLNRIGEGTYGTVYRAEDTKRGGLVALKKVIVHNEGHDGTYDAVCVVYLSFSFSKSTEHLRVAARARTPPPETRPMVDSGHPRPALGARMRVDDRQWPRRRRRRRRRRLCAIACASQLDVPRPMPSPPLAYSSLLSQTQVALFAPSPSCALGRPASSTLRTHLSPPTPHPVSPPPLASPKLCILHLSPDPIHSLSLSPRALPCCLPRIPHHVPP